MRGQRLESQKALVKRMAKVATKLVPDGTGVKVDFINRNIVEDDLDESGVHHIMDNVRLTSGTPIGTRLREKILEPLIYDRIGRGERLTRPHLIMVITDGAPTNETDPPPAFKNSIIQCMERLHEANYEPEGEDISVSI
jgi:hypothetical protein